MVFLRGLRLGYLFEYIVLVNIWGLLVGTMRYFRVSDIFWLKFTSSKKTPWHLFLPNHFQVFEFGLILAKIFQFENLNHINCYTTNTSNTTSKLQLSAFLRFCYNTHNSFRFILLIHCQLFMRTRWSVWRLGIVRLDTYRGKQNEWYKKCWMERGNSEICTSYVFD